MLAASLIIENSYSSVLKSLLTVPVYEDPVDTITKFAKTKWNWSSPAEAWVLTIAESKIEYEQIMTEKFVIMNSEELLNATETHIGIGIERLNGGSYSFGDYIRDGNMDNFIVIIVWLCIVEHLVHI